MIGVRSNLRKDLIRESETITNSNSFQTCQKSSFLFSLNNFSGNGWSILASVALSKDNEWIGSRDREVESAKASLSVVEFIESSIEISSNL
jgi:hypothetical protein